MLQHKVGIQMVGCDPKYGSCEYICNAQGQDNINTAATHIFTAFLCVSICSIVNLN